MMDRRLLAALAAILALAACQGNEGPEIVIRDVQIFAPVPGSVMGVAYLTIDNNGAKDIVIAAARSPQFDTVEMHETVEENGVSRMRALAAVTVPAGGSIRFEPGGRHWMLMGPRDGAAAGSSVTLEIEHSAGLLLVSATMQPRLPAG